ncbi:MAG: hydroxymethylbilane synthase [Terrisporobacter othiniensis]|uniref:hydroxymethylbilane synthase n=1 Tax=Terrisporobacter petrolearius TaxID=1460447 RepID=UPI0022E7183C|nr:hydroxymethylbilane synthase [Terrisporobacter petrolearius]MDU4861771.1 hydroxymethylbilane synthase [Terrisporobacter othiniensis]MDU6995031.1 hydroxymethylbilane synthase [Terrisporobacter othiniensis]
MKIVVGTRGSKLALIQTNWVVEELKKANPDIEFEIKIIKTKGDLVTHLPLHKIGDKGLFTKEIEQQLLDREIDLAVHSMKDMPSNLPQGLKFANVPKREDPRDILVLNENYKTLEDLPHGAKIGTGSKRRIYQLLKYRPDLEIVPIRGNIDTRIRKIEDENLHGIVLAAAGLLRAGLKDRISYYLPTNIMIPAPAQGALALEIRENDLHMEEIISHIKDETSEIQVAAERGFLEGVNGSCHVPMGAYCEINDDKLTLTGLYGDEEGRKLVVKSKEGSIEDSAKIGFDLAEEVLKEYNKL